MKHELARYLDASQLSAIFYQTIILTIAFVFIYRILSDSQREWIKGYLIPIIFFLFLAGKTLRNAIALLGNKAYKSQSHILILLSVNNLLILSFMSLAIISYIIRSRPIHKACGIKERAFPIFVLFSQFAGSYFIGAHTRFRFQIFLYISGIIISILGTIMGCFALWELKRSFSIMVEVRKLITKGIYSKVRHPLYAGELLHLFGIAMLFNNTAAYGLFVFLFFMQSLRAVLEEKKLSSHFPEYETYKDRTGFFFPKLKKTNS
ncbi:isoprenylcysteine carboxylmethyltransferase family protein [bacterium]|nr:isoprenylcysteine carboxylmethyltransferase family protein [bacterium]